MIVWRHLLCVGAALCLLGSVATAIAGSGRQDGAQVASAPAGPAANAAYAANCAACHGAGLTGGFAPALKGPAFARKWKAKGADALYALTLSTMPPGRAGQLPAADYRRIVDMIAAANGIGSKAADAAPVPATDGHAPRRNRLGRIERPAEANLDSVAQKEQTRRTALLGAMRPVDAAMLERPPAGDWLHWRRTYDAAASSPLNSIGPANVAGLRLVWSLSLAPGGNQIAPLVHDGVMFVTSGGETLAIDGAGGDILWRYTRNAVQAGARNQSRGMAMVGDRLFVPTIDARMVALDARTGALAWDRRIAPDAAGAQFIAGPLAVRDMLVQGVAGCATDAMPGGCFLVAIDAATGAERWRVNTVARPGEPGGDSWNGAPLDKRFGGAIWTTASYDPALGLVYAGTGQTYRTATLRQPAAAPNAANAALHTDSTLAVDAATGKLAWSYQHMAGDVWDMDWGFEQTLTTLGGKPVVATVGKIGIVDLLDARTGAYRGSRDLGLQRLVTAIDLATGAKTTDPALLPAADDEKGVAMCPSSFGVRNWPASAFDAASGTLFLPMYEACQDFFWNPGSAWDISWQLRPMPGSDGKLGRIAAIDLATGKPRWVRRDRSPPSSAILRSGGLIFAGWRDRWFRALDERSGETLWETRLSAAPNAFPVTYQAGGRQFVAIVAGGGGPLDSGFASLTPEVTGASGSPTLFVFALGK